MTVSTQKWMILSHAKVEGQWLEAREEVLTALQGRCASPGDGEGSRAAMQVLEMAVKSVI